MSQFSIRFNDSIAVTRNVSSFNSSKPVETLNTGDLLQSCFLAYPKTFESTDMLQLTLHLPTRDFDNEEYNFNNDWFDNRVKSPGLGISRPVLLNVLLSDLGRIGTDIRVPLQIYDCSHTKAKMMLKWSVEQLDINDVLEAVNQLLPSDDKVRSYTSLPTIRVNDIEIPSFNGGGEPSLLFWKLGSLDVEELHRRATENEVTVMIGTSGCGKTRQIFEVLSKTYGVYITVKNNGAQAGSEDFTNIFMDRLSKYLIQSDPVFNRAYTDRMFNCLILARLLVFNYLHDKFKLSPQEWLYFQLKFNFEEIVLKLRELYEEDLKTAINNNLSHMRQQNATNTKFMPIFLDEAQSIVSEHNMFFSTSNNEQVKSLYCAVATSARSIPDCSFIACGTGLKLQDVKIILSNSSKKEDKDLKYIVCNSFNNHEEIFDYIQDICAALTVDESKSNWFFGRVRFLVSYVEFQLSRLYEGKAAMDVFDYVEYVIRPSIVTKDISLARTFNDNRFKGNPSERTKYFSILRDTVLHFICSGKGKVFPVAQCQLFELSFGLIGYFGEYRSLSIMIHEPLMMRAALEHVFEKNEIKVVKNHFKIRVSNDLEPSSQDFMKVRKLYCF